MLDSLIPVLRNNKWGLFDTKGNQVVAFEYDSFGYIASSNREAENLLVIPNYNVIVACLNNRYTLLNASGEQPIRAFVDDIYMTISGGEKHYQMTANDKTYDVEEYLDRLGVQPTTNNQTNTTNTTSNTTQSNITQSNTSVVNEVTSNQVNNETAEETTETNNDTQQSNGEEQNREQQGSEQ